MNPDPLALATPRIARGRTRLGAAFADGVLLGALPALVVLFLFGWRERETAITLASAWSLFLFFAFESAAGQTPGKKSAGLRVVMADGRPAGMGPIAVRTVLRVVDSLPSFYLVGIVTMLISGEQRQRVGDLAAGTVVAVAAPGGAAEMVNSGPAAVPEVPGPTLPPARRRRPRDLVLAAVGCILIALIGGNAIISAMKKTPQDAIKERVNSFVDARAKNNARRACDQLTEDAQRDMVARIERVVVERADASRCERYVLKDSSRSVFTKPDLRAFEGADLAVRIYVGGGAAVNPVTAPQANLHAMKVGDRWMLDSMGPFRGSFIAGCSSSGPSKAYCACVFEQFRDRGPQGMNDLKVAYRRAQATGRPEGRLAETLRTCSVAA
jgi:uncharacterized RDD family membrane protein YckC